MNEIMIAESRTPIEVALEMDENGLVSAKKLYEFLELNPKNYSHWTKKNIVNNEYALAGDDYSSFVLQDERNPNPTTEYLLSAPFTKKLCMISKSPKGEEARNYFIGCEEGLKRAILKAAEIQNQDIILKLNNLQKQIIDLSESQSTKKKDKPIPNSKLSERGMIFQKRIKRLSNHLYKDGIKGISLKDTISYLISAMRDKYGINFNAYVKAYKKKYKTREMPFRMYVVDEYEELSDYFEQTLDYIEAQYNLDNEEIMNELYIE